MALTKKKKKWGMAGVVWAGVGERVDHICTGRLIRNIQKESQVICNITESTIKIQWRSPGLVNAQFNEG